MPFWPWGSQPSFHHGKVSVSRCEGHPWVHKGKPFISSTEQHQSSSCLKSTVWLLYTVPWHKICDQNLVHIFLFNTFDGRNPASVEVGWLSHYLHDFIHPRWFSRRISEPPTTVSSLKSYQNTQNPPSKTAKKHRQSHPWGWFPATS